MKHSHKRAPWTRDPRKSRPLLLLVVLLTGFGSEKGGGTLLAQEGAFAYQIRGGAAISLGDFRSGEEGWEERAGGGASLAMGFTLPLWGPLGAYLGFGQHRFSCDEDLCPSGKNWVSTGFDVALRLVLGRSRLRPWFQAGFHNHRMEGRILSDGGAKRLTSDGGGGFETGGGLLVQIGERMSLSPGIRYGEGNVPFSEEGRMRPRYMVMDLGLVVGF